jgi:flagellar hook-associated protein 3 FlgL
MIARNLISNISKNRERAAELELDMASGKKIRRPSDDPAAVAKIQRLNTDISKNEQYLKNIGHIYEFTSYAASALDVVAEELQGAKEIALQGASGTLDPDARRSLAGRVDQNIDSMVDLANSKFNNRYLFAGSKTNTKPFTRTGDVITYDGNDKSISGKIGFQADVAYNKTGSEVFNAAGGVDVFQAMIDLKQGLENNDQDAVQASVAVLDDAIRQITDKTADLGALQSRLNLTEEMIESNKISLAESLSKTQDTDVVEALVEHTIVENALNAGLKTMSKTIQTTLVDFIG